MVVIRICKDRLSIICNICNVDIAKRHNDTGYLSRSQSATKSHVTYTVKRPRIYPISFSASISKVWRVYRGPKICFFFPRAAFSRPSPNCSSAKQRHFAFSLQQKKTTSRWFVFDTLRARYTKWGCASRENHDACWSCVLLLANDTRSTEIYPSQLRNVRGHVLSTSDTLSSFTAFPAKRTCAQFPMLSAFTDQGYGVSTLLSMSARVETSERLPIERTFYLDKISF